MTAIKNIAIIAHVDHGKTTLVDKILHHCNLFRSNENKGDLILDNNDLERERGITILSKNVSVVYKDVKINIIDTPGHADFGGEVERVLNMADGVLLLVDAFEGPMPQTRFVLKKAIDLKLKPIVVINKVDKENCTPELVHESVFDLMFELEAEEWQLDFPTVYGSAKNNWMSTDWNNQTDSVEPLLDMVLEHVPSPEIKDGNTQMLITSLDFSSFTGRIAIGRLQRIQATAMAKSGSITTWTGNLTGPITKTIRVIFSNHGAIRRGTKPSGQSCYSPFTPSPPTTGGSAPRATSTMPRLPTAGITHTAVWFMVMPQTDASVTVTNIFGCRLSRLQVPGDSGASQRIPATCSNTPTRGRGRGRTWLTTKTALGFASSTPKATRWKPPSHLPAKSITTPWVPVGMS